MEIGDQIGKRIGYDEWALPIFIWDTLKIDNHSFYIINSEKGLTVEGVRKKFNTYSNFLPVHSKYEIKNEEELKKEYQKVLYNNKTNPYLITSDGIKEARSGKVMDVVLAFAYLSMNLNHIGRALESLVFKSTEERIEKDKYRTIRKLPEDKESDEYLNQNIKNMVAHFKFEFLPKKFIVLKIIKLLKEIMSSNFPASVSEYSNSIIENLLLGMFMSYYKSNEENIKSATINYANNYPGDFKKFSQFKLVLKKFDKEISSYEKLKMTDEELKKEYKNRNITLPTAMNEKGIIMKLLEFDMSFWQKLILQDIEKDVPVAKPFNKGISESYNYMLLLPYFKWLASELFPDLSNKKIKKENYESMMVDRMKNFQKGKSLQN